MLEAGILDHVLVRRDSSASQAISETFELARKAESLGFKRFWVGEQHLDRSGCGTPESIMPILLEKTQSIRIGSGGIMLNHMNPYRIAKSAQLLTRVYGDRLDLGFGRANGADGAELKGLKYGLLPLTFDEKFATLRHYFDHSLGDAECDGLQLFRDCPKPELFLLSSTPSAVAEAASRGVSVAAPHFISPTDAVHALQSFRGAVRGSGPDVKQPRSILAVQVIVSDDQRSLHRRSLNFLRHVQNLNLDPRSFLPARDDRPAFGPEEAESLKQLSLGPTLIGTGSRVKDRLRSLWERARADELVFVIYGPGLEDKLESLHILAEMLKDGSIQGSPFSAQILQS